MFCYELSILNGPCAGHDNLSPIGFRNSRSLLRFWLACVHVTRGVRAMLRKSNRTTLEGGGDDPEIHSRVKNVMSLRDLFASLLAITFKRNAAFAKPFSPGVKWNAPFNGSGIACQRFAFM